MNLFKSYTATEHGQLFAFLTADGKATPDSAIKAAKALSKANEVITSDSALIGVSLSKDFKRKPIPLEVDEYGRGLKGAVTT